MSEVKNSPCNTKHESNSANNFEKEISNLRDQITALQVNISTLHVESENKERAVAKLAREKEQLSIDLQKEKRSSTGLKQQLDEEREFYFKEKKQYCHEMNECRKIKKEWKNNLHSLPVHNEDDSKEVVQYKNQISRLVSYCIACFCILRCT